MYENSKESYLTFIGMSYESKKNAHLWRHLGVFFIRLNELVKLTRLMSIFTSKKFGNFYQKNQLIKSNPKITREVKVPCIMPIRVKLMFAVFTIMSVGLISWSVFKIMYIIF